MAVTTREREAVEHESTRTRRFRIRLPRMISGRKKEPRPKYEPPVLPQVKQILSEEEIDGLKVKGYTPGQIIGEGNTRYAIRCVYETPEGFRTMRVIKVPKRKVPQTSVCTYLNASKLPHGNPNVLELQCAGGISHENIVGVYDSFKVGDRVFTAEEDFPSETLEQMVQRTGPLEREDILGIFSQLTSAVSYLHEYHAPGNWFSTPIIHRDLKPSNVLVNSHKKVKLTDFQNAKKKEEITESFLPTRGGTRYTRPDVLNSVFTRQKTKCDERTDIFSIGASLYYALTGKTPFEYDIVYDEEGRPLDVGGKIIKVSLVDGERRLEEITREEHERNKRRALKMIPRAYRGLLDKALTLDPKKQYKYIGQFAERLKYTDKKQATRDFIGRYWKPAFWVGSIGAIVGLLAFTVGKNTSMVPVTYQPTLHDLLDGKRYFIERGTSGIETPATSQVLIDLKPYAAEVLDTTRTREIARATDFAQRVSQTRIGGFKSREYNSIILACKFTDGKKKDRCYATEDRSSTFLVPRGFTRAFQDGATGVHDNWEDSSYVEANYAWHYLNMNRRVGDRAEELFTRYFCSDDEVNSAKMQAVRFYLGNDFFTYKNDANQRHIDEIFGRLRFYPTEQADSPRSGILVPGYGEYLPAAKKELIDRAISYYLLLDENGKRVKETSNFYMPDTIKTGVEMMYPQTPWHARQARKAR